MSLKEFAENYLPPAQKTMALMLLKEGDRSLEEWRSCWQKVLNSPAK